ncbi:MAG: hypothetical protein K9W43_09495 [Candidatus Thorarchaeota archaeon]|nr:hypothetical protein [Candidatus Thorarchaeota archaeon]
MIEFIIAGFAIIMLVLAYMCFKGSDEDRRYSSRYVRGRPSEAEIDADLTEIEMKARIMTDREDLRRQRYRSM